MTGRGRARTAGATDAAPRELYAVEVDGQRVVFDSRGLSLRERQMVRAELAKLQSPDQMDFTAGVIWATMRRSDSSLTFADVCDALTIGDLLDAEPVSAEEGDSPEA